MPEPPEPASDDSSRDSTLTPAEPGAAEEDPDDEIAELLLADAVAADEAAEPEPDMGDTDQPDMGDVLTQPAAPAPTAPATQPTQPPASQPAQQTPPAGAQTMTVPSTGTTTFNPAVPQFVAPTAAPGGDGQQTQGSATDQPGGFPANTPWRDMAPDQQVAYWQHQARRHEERVKSMGDYDDLKRTSEEYQRLVAASQTEQERAVAEARRQGHAEALSAAGGQLVEQWMRAATAGRIPEESVNALLEGLDRSRFLSKDGGVDTGKVYAFVNSIAPAPAAASQPQPTPGQPAGQAAPAAQPAGIQPLVRTPAGGAPDFGQGQPGTSRPSGLAAGREIARQRFAAQQKK